MSVMPIGYDGWKRGVGYDPECTCEECRAPEDEPLDDDYDGMDDDDAEE